MDSRLEERYVVIKLKHLVPLARAELIEVLDKYCIPTTDCVVVEHDWPEYTPTVDAIMDRVHNDEKI